MNAPAATLPRKPEAPRVSVPPAPASDTPAIEMRDVEIHFGTGKTAVRAVSQLDLNIGRGEFVSVLGPSGCGKSTLIGAVAGFTPVSAGALRVDGELVREPGPERGVVFQHHTLFPWKRVLENVESGSRCAARAAPSGARRRAPSWRRSGSATSRATIRGSCRAACSSG